MAQYLNVILPIALVVMAFLLKLFMDQSATVPLFIRSLFELPVSVIFLALSFATAYTITSPNNISSGMCHLYIFLVLTLICVVLWRRCTILFERNSHFWASVLFIINGTISGFVLYRAIGLVISQVTL